MGAVSLQVSGIAITILGATAGATGAEFGLPLATIAAVGWTVCQVRTRSGERDPVPDDSFDDGCPAVSVPITPFEPVIVWHDLNVNLRARHGAEADFPALLRRDRSSGLVTVHAQTANGRVDCGFLSAATSSGIAPLVRANTALGIISTAHVYLVAGPDGAVDAWLPRTPGTGAARLP